MVRNIGWPFGEDRIALGVCVRTQAKQHFAGVVHVWFVHSASPRTTQLAFLHQHRQGFLDSRTAGFFFLGLLDPFHVLALMGGRQGLEAGLRRLMPPERLLEVCRNVYRLALG